MLQKSKSIDEFECKGTVYVCVCVCAHVHVYLSVCYLCVLIATFRAWSGRQRVFISGFYLDITILVFSTLSFSTSSAIAYHHLVSPSNAIQPHNCGHMAYKSKEENMLKYVFIELAFFYCKNYHLSFNGHVSRSKTACQWQLFQFHCSSRTTLFLNIGQDLGGLKPKLIKILLSFLES